MTASANLNRRTIVENITTLFSGSIVAQGMTALALLLTARQLSVAGYGQYAACIAITSMASILFSLGLDLWLLREGGREPGELATYAGSVLAIKGSIGIIWIVVFLLIAPMFNQETYPASLLRWSVLLIWLDTLLATTLTAFKAGVRNRVPAALEAGADTVWCGLTVGMIFYGVRQPEGYFIGRIIVSTIALAVGWMLLYRIFGLRIDITVARSALHGAFPFATSEFLGMVTMRADVVIVGLILGKIATGLYSPAVGLINMAFLAPLAVYLVAVPVLSNLYKNHPGQAKKSAGRFILLSLGLGILLTTGFWAAAPLVMYVLGEAFQGSVAILRILSLVLIFKSVSFAMAASILATGQQAKRTMVRAAAAAFNIGANLLVVTRVGIDGVAWVYVLTEVILLTGYSWIVWRIRV